MNGYWWARQELNLRSPPCQGGVITPRPRALGVNATLTFQMKDSKFLLNSRDYFRYFSRTIFL